MTKVCIIMAALSLMASFVLGCAQDQIKAEESETSIGEIKKAVVSVIGSPREISQNQREFTSQYSELPNTKPKERVYYVVTILGSRRPYEVEVKALVEQKQGISFIEVGEDARLAQKLLKDIQSKLHQGRDGRNLIDDFRAF